MTCKQICSGLNWIRTGFMTSCCLSHVIFFAKRPLLVAITFCAIEAIIFHTFWYIHSVNESIFFFFSTPEQSHGAVMVMDGFRESFRRGQHGHCSHRFEGGDTWGVGSLVGYRWMHIIIPVGSNEYPPAWLPLVESAGLVRDEILEM